MHLKHATDIRPLYNKLSILLSGGSPHVANLKASLVALPISLTGLFATLKKFNPPSYTIQCDWVNKDKKPCFQTLPCLY